MAVAARAAAVVDSAPTFVRDARVRTVVTRKPVLCGMTGRAIQPEHPGMVSRIGMAARTGDGEACELSRSVTLFARQHSVASRQREFTQVVVEGGVLPSRRVVTDGTVRAEASAVFIVLAVTGIAIGRGAGKHIVPVTGFTRRLGMSALQFES